MRVCVLHGILRRCDVYRAYPPTIDLLTLERCDTFDARRKGLAESDALDFAKALRGSRALMHSRWKRRADEAISPAISGRD